MEELSRYERQRPPLNEQGRRSLEYKKAGFEKVRQQEAVAYIFVQATPMTLETLDGQRGFAASIEEQPFESGMYGIFFDDSFDTDQAVIEFTKLHRHRPDALIPINSGCLGSSEEFWALLTHNISDIQNDVAPGLWVSLDQARLRVLKEHITINVTQDRSDWYLNDWVKLHHADMRSSY